jgi:uroporphyrinogen-III synthase
MVPDAINLKGRTVAITRPADQADETADLIKSYGGLPYFIPSIVIRQTCDLASVKRFISELKINTIDYVMFMSVNGISYLVSCSEVLGLKEQLLDALNKVVVLAVGPKTAQELVAFGVSVDLIPGKYSSEGIIDCLNQHEISGKTVYIPRTKGAPPDLANSLRNLGAVVHELYVYESLLPSDQNLNKEFLEDLRSGKIDAIVFGSSLSAKNLFEMLSNLISKNQLQDLLNAKLVVVAIGPTTAQALSGLGLQVDVMPEKYLFTETLKALAKYWES